jgi:hypothetical protein
MVYKWNGDRLLASISRLLYLCNNKNRHTNRHTALLKISDLLEPASINGLRRLVNFYFRPFGILGDLQKWQSVKKLDLKWRLSGNLMITG